MEFLSNTWVLWLVICVVALVAMSLYRQGRTMEADQEMATAEDFSIKTILFGFRKGEGDLFVGFLVGMIACSFFVAGLVRWVQTIF